MPPKRIIPWKIPESLLNNQRLNYLISENLPNNYNFEIHKTIWRIRCLNARKIVLQMPEGLLLFSVQIITLLQEFSHEDKYLDATVFGDVTYGACCVDDYSAKALNIDLLVHYGHSCLVPLDSISVLYVFVDIQIDLDHFIRTIKANFDKSLRIVMVSTIQFVTSLQAAKEVLNKEDGYNIIIPQSYPLSPGEILGCTSPKVSDADAIIYLGDGRFHLESMMISNPLLPAYRYDPYDKSLTKELYDHEAMRIQRKSSIDAARKAKRFGIILGTLGRQGSVAIVNRIQDALESANKTSVILLLSEIFPDKLKLFGEEIDAWIQVACPRLSIDWGSEFDKPIITPYETFVALSKIEWPFDNDPKTNYPMDYYANDSLGPWTPNHDRKKSIGCRNKS